MKNVVVTGSNRGIGLALCRHLSSRGYKVFGACRKPSTDLEKINGLQVIPGVDVGVDDGVAPLKHALANTKVDVLICNAGVLIEDDLSTVTMDGIRKQFEVNTLGPLRTVLALMPNLDKGSKVVVVTSRMGSIGDGSGSDYGYRISKAGVNMAFSSLSHDVKSKGIAVGILHPGFVLTDMTAKYAGQSGVIDVDTSATDMLNIIEKELTMETTGTFWHRNGTILPW